MSRPTSHFGTSPVASNLHIVKLRIAERERGVDVVDVAGGVASPPVLLYMSRCVCTRPHCTTTRGLGEFSILRGPARCITARFAQIVLFAAS
eukprot:6181412-Pleurochrysis_carterae.AAC.2